MLQPCQSLLARLWQDDRGAILASEFVMLGTIAVAGTSVGLIALRNAVNDELVDYANSIRALDQSYSFNGVKGPGCYTAGSSFKNGPAHPIHLTHTPAPQPVPVSSNTQD